ncbi:hypothetical protein GBN33_03075 [Plesiomonas shigelloides]|uniref:hypothetical protein n=1 Tax=Plesiomonas shigelloides TaxID=703 RepID=UPI0012618E09|nr:hypothetical protein [Plesiomonas shigelloides]KAB7702096.1 hypothetical protein GBN33_03075 [Plesiomonas shigelloides]
MDEKIIIGILGVIIGFLLNFVKELFTSRSVRKKEAEYLAIRMICIFEPFLHKCVSVAYDDGLTDKDGYSHAQTSTPDIDVEIKDVNWKSLPSELMYEILYFPSLIKNANRYISDVAENNSTPPDFDEVFEERQYQYALIGIKAAAIIEKLKSEYDIDRSNTGSGHGYAIEHLIKRKSIIDSIRRSRDK